MPPIRPPTLLASGLAWLLLVTPGCPAAPSTESAAGLVNLAGEPAKPFAQQEAPWQAFIFVRVDCPIANVYAPEIQRLADQYARRGVTFQLVYCDADETAPVIRKHLEEYGYRLPVWRDPRQQFARQSKVKFTPEAAVYRADGKLLYHGRIDDRYVNFGQARPQPERRDLVEALEAALAGRTIPAATGPAVGCAIEGH